jgi:hypothetical protein
MTTTTSNEGRAAMKRATTTRTPTTATYEDLRPTTMTMTIDERP